MRLVQPYVMKLSSIINLFVVTVDLHYRYTYCRNESAIITNIIIRFIYRNYVVHWRKMTPTSLRSGAGESTAKTDRRNFVLEGLQPDSSYEAR